jgi:hypothetical protein
MRRPLRWLLAALAPQLLSAQGPPAASPTAVLRFGDAGDVGQPAAAVLGARLMPGHGIAVLLQSPDGQTLLVRDRQSRVVAQWRIATGDAVGQLVVHRDSLFLLAGAGEDLRVLTYVLGERRMVAETAVPAHPERPLLIRGGPSSSWQPVLAPSRTLRDAASPVNAAYTVQWRDGRQVDVADQRDRVPFTVATGPQRSTLFLTTPWDPAPPVELSGDTVIVGRPALGQIELVTTAGVAQRIEVHSERGTLDDAAATAWRETWLAQQRASRLFPESALAQVAAQPLPTQRPMFRALFADGLRQFAVVRDDLHPLAGPAAAPVVVDIVARDGRVVSRVTLPPGSTVRGLVDGELLVTEPDRTRLLRLKREAAPKPADQVVVYRVGG